MNIVERLRGDYSSRPVSTYCPCRTEGGEVMFGIPSIKREGQTMLNMCMEQCEGVYLMNEIERLRDALQKIKKRNPFHNVSPPMDKQYYAQIITEMVGIANAALKEGE